MEMKVFKCPECGANIDLTTDKGFFFCPFWGVRIYDTESINININKKVEKDVRNHAKMREAEAYEKIELEKLRKEGNAENSKRFYTFLITIAIILVTALVIVFTGQVEVIIFSLAALIMTNIFILN